MLETPDKKGGGGMPVRTVVFALAAVVGLAGGYFFYQDWMDRAPLLPQLTEEAKAYNAWQGNVEGYLPLQRWY